MSEIGKLLGALALGRQLIDHIMLRRFLSGLATLLLLIIVSGMIVGAVIIGLFYGLYLFLLAQGLPAASALMLTILVVVLVAVIILLVTASHARRTIEVSKLITNIEHSFMGQLKPILDAFVDGLLTRPSPVRESPVPAEE